MAHKNDASKCKHQARYVGLIEKFVICQLNYTTVLTVIIYFMGLEMGHELIRYSILQQWLIPNHTKVSEHVQYTVYHFCCTLVKEGASVEGSIGLKCRSNRGVIFYFGGELNVIRWTCIDVTIVLFVLVWGSVQFLFCYNSNVGINMHHVYDSCFSFQL